MQDKIIDMDKSISIMKNNDRYKTFKFLDKPQPFNEYFEGKTYPIVQIYDPTPVGDTDIIGFAGVFSWEFDTLVALDGDSYYSYMNVWAFEEFEHNGQTCLSIVSDNW